MPKSAKQAANEAAMRKSNLLKASIAGVVILGCAVWIGYTLLADRTVTEIKPSTPAERFMAGTGVIFDNERFEHASFSPSADGTRITVAGTVRTQAELDELKRLVEQLASDTSNEGVTVQIDWEAKVGG